MLSVGMALPLHECRLPCRGTHSESLGDVRRELRGQRVTILRLDRQEDIPVPTIPGSRR